VVVAVTGFEGYQGGLDQASGGPPEVQSHFRLDGRNAVYTPQRTDQFGDERWADLVAVRGTDLAVRVTARDATRQRLVEVLRRVRPSLDHTQAPAVPDPPAGLRVIGSVDAAAVVALDRESIELGPRSARGAAWRRGPARLTVAALPGRSADLAAVAGYRALLQWHRAEVQPREVGGRPGLVLEGAGAPDGGFPQRAVVTSSRWGDLLIVMAHTGAEQRGAVLPEDDLVAVAASVRRGPREGGAPPAGPPPADEAAARAAVTATVMAWAEAVRSGGARFDLIDDPHGLDVAVGEARRNVPRELAEHSVEVSLVQFLDATHAQVTYTLLVPGNAFRDRVGQVVLVNGTWKLTRETICTDLLLASATCPP
jgi:hypothetical protein